MLQTSWTSYGHCGFALIAVLCTFVAVVAIQWRIQASRWTGWARSSQGVAPPFINIIGVLFGLTIGSWRTTPGAPMIAR